MIIAGAPELGLQNHQQEAYREVTKAYETGNRAAVVVPTGCGKSFIALQLMEDNRDKNMLFLAPTDAIKDQMYRYIAKYIVGEEPSKGRTAIKIAEEHFPKLKIILYPSLLRAKTEVFDKLNPDIIIMDELHRTGADKWGESIDYLLENNPNAKVLGLTATPDRADDKDVIDRLFTGNISYELTLVEAMRRRILKAPQYVTCHYAFIEELEKVEEYIDTCDNPKNKKEAEEIYKQMKIIVDRAEGIPELFEHNITKKDGKYIVFCKDKEHLDEIMPKMQEWLQKIDTEPEMYSVYSGYGSKSNKETIKQFENSKTEHIKLLFSVDMLNEGLHVEDISGVVMLRPTESRIIYLQQLGRALSSDSSRDQTIILDLVNNYLKNNLDKELNPKRYAEKGEERNREENHEDEKDEDIDTFRVTGKTQDFLELLEEFDKLKQKDALKEMIDILKLLQEKGVNVLDIKKSDTIETILERQKISKDIVEEIEKEVKLDWAIGVRNSNQKSSEKIDKYREALKENGLPEELAEVAEKVDALKEMIEVLKLLQESGVNVLDIKQKDTIETILERQKISKESVEEIEKEVKLDWPIGMRNTTQKLSQNVDKYREALKENGLPEELGEVAEKVDALKEMIDVLKLLQEKGVNVLDIKKSDTIETILERQKISKDIVEEIEKEVELDWPICVRNNKQKSSRKIDKYREALKENGLPEKLAEKKVVLNAQEIGKSGLGAPVTDCDEVERAIRTMQQTKEVTH